MGKQTAAQQIALEKGRQTMTARKRQALADGCAAGVAKRQSVKQRAPAVMGLRCLACRGSNLISTGQRMLRVDDGYAARRWRCEDCEDSYVESVELSRGKYERLRNQLRAELIPQIRAELRLEADAKMREALKAVYG